MRSHARYLKLGLDRFPAIATQLLQSYVAHRSPASLCSAHQVFDQVPHFCRDPFLYAALISSLARAATLPATASALHAFAVRRGIIPHVVVATSILNSYSKTGDFGSSVKLFDEMPIRNRVTWNSMVAAYTNAGLGALALETFCRMRSMDVEVGVDGFTVSSALTACAGIGDAGSGEQLHGYLVIAGFDSDDAVVNALSNMYFRCGDVDEAERAMDGREDSANGRLIILKGYVFNERYRDAIRLINHGYGFVEMVMMDPTVIVSVLVACANLRLLRAGRQLHGLIVLMDVVEHHQSLNIDVVVLGSALIDMYCKCYSIDEAQSIFHRLPERHVSHWNSLIAGCIHNGLLEEACRLFDDMPVRNVISWTSMISGHMQHGLPREGLMLLAKMYSEGGSIRGNCFTFATALNACSFLASLSSGKEIHAQALRTTTQVGSRNIVLETAIVDMYSKSGSLTYARKVFDMMRDKNVVSWTSMISGYAAHGLGHQAIEVFEQMMSMGFEPNEVTFVAVLTVCSHCGLVKQGLHYFNLMRNYSINPSGDHYTSVVDMLARAGKLVEAWTFVEELKQGGSRNDAETGTNISDDAAIWGALLGGCHLHGNVEIGGKVAARMIERNLQPSGTYVALSNVFASSQMWEEVYRVREEWRSQGVGKEPGNSQIQIGSLG